MPRRSSKKSARSKNVHSGEVYSSAELSRKLGHRTAVARLVQAGELVPLGAGFYSAPGVDPFVAQVHVIAKYYPKAVISGVSALFIHKLSDERLDKVHVDLPKGIRLRNQLVESRRVVPSRLVGIQRLSFHGKPIRIYDIERSLCDAYRADRGALFFKALKRYLKDCRPNPEALARYDKVLGTRVLRSLQQELADA